ncbi:putative secreted protein (Por secretion system target) [Winogradskyella pacifica]|uniref:Putative secreted protein (Por secretion system target) n=1 Tax=Winogradskyella pacifica TaxID=664642 RepID=A0A3D9LP91_9FLAO|nr:LamG-like jellyroll fold domain-containing protein [Winogradskyella pacifica]REE08247.1 putative secreted protein (Por secretion system target) [Winogradskyella pacifica]
MQCLGDVPTADITVVTDEADNCGTPTVAFVSQTADPAINNGTITRTYSVTDASGNSINVYQDIVILDNTDPTASNPADINVQCLGDVPTADITVVTDEADNCGTPTVAFVSQTTDPAINNGTITRTYSVTDASGNSINVYQDIVILDNTDPTASNPADINVQCLGDVPAADITVVNDEADNCGTPTVAFVSQTADPAINNGTITRTYSVTDASGNSINVYQNIVILDNNAPITPTLATLNGQCSVTATVPTTTDACAGTITGTTSDPLTYNVQGTYTIVWNFDDGNGNHINVNQTVNVEDTIDPITPTLATLNGQCSVTATAPTTTDACAGTIIGTTSDPSTYNAQGTYTIVWNFDDGNGNDINVNQTVVVDDTIAPTPNTVTLSNITAQCSVTSLTAPTATDNCSGVIAGSHNATLPITVQGTTVITWTYDDGNGNTFTQTQNVIITDTTPPVVVCQNISITLDAGGNATINATDIDNGSTDNCAIASMSLNKYNFNCDDLGTNTVTLTVYDVYGNTDTCTATVTVLDPASSASVTIASNDIDLNDEICLGDNLTFTVTPLNAGTTQYYEWFINGVSEGTTAVPTFTPAFVPTTDYTIYAEMTTDLSACDPKVSNTISIIVHPLPIVSVSSYDICIDDNSQITIPSTGGTWVSNNLSVATINSTSGAITPVSTGTVTFTFTDSITGCENTTNTVTINPLPVISNYPIDNEICENETHTLSPSTGGTWTSSDPTIATITNSGLVTGVSVGINVSFTYTDSSTGCSSTSAPFTVLEIPEITAVEAFPNTICSGEDTVVSVSVAGAGTAEVVIVNYDFNSGNNYGQLNGQEAPNINSFVSSNISFDRTQQGRNASAIPPYFAINDRKQGLRQNDDWRDGSQDWFNNPGGSDDDGDWIFNINGSDLPNYQNFEIYFDAKRQDPGGNNKRVRVEYSTDNGTSWSFAGDRLLPSGTTSWSRYSSTLPGVTNPSNLQIRLNVNDGSTYSYSFWSGYDDQTNPHVVIDNFQVKASTLLTTGIGYNWSVLSGDFSSLPADTDLSQITVTPSVTTEYQVEVTNSDDCPAFETVTVNVNPSPEITFTTNYCPSAPHNNEVEITAISSMPGTTFEWIITYPSPGDSNYDHGGHSNTSATAYVDTAGSYQVIATGPAPNYCVTSAFVEIANELVTNGDFELGNTGFSSDYNYKEDLPGLVPAGQGELYNDSGNNGYSITTNGQNVHDNFWGYDHTTGSGNFMAVNGHGSSLVVWSQDIIVEPNTAYYFSAWGMSMNWQNNTNNRAQLTFNVDGTNLGTAPILPNRSNNNAPGADNWQRFYGDWTSPNWPGPQTITIEIRNLNWRTSGNDFGIDDISFSSLDPFILLVSPPETINDQIICQGNEIDDILYSAGGGSTGADIQWQLDGSNLGTGPFPNNTNPTGIVTTFDGSRYTISGTPTVPGNYTFTVYTTGSCGTPKTSSGEFVVNEAPIVLITTLPQTICQSENSLVLSAILDGSATLGTWSTSGTGSFSGVSGNGINATYNFGTNETGTVTLTFTSNDPDGTGSNGPCDVAEVTIDIEITPYFEATTGSNITTSGCDDNTVTLTGNNVTGQWSVTSGQTADSYFFSDITAHNSTFTGESGETYTLQWSATNTGVCSPNTIATMKVIIPDCGASLVFDGGDDYINFGDNYNLNNTDFSIEAWIKVNTTTGTKTIFSKRDGTSTASGYDLSLIGDRLQFRYNGNTNVVSTQPINSDKWYHAAVTFDGSTYILYIDGFEVRTRAGTTPTTNANKALIGAMDRTGDSPINYFDGKIDEVRIWDTQLSQTQIREMMNQEIKQDGSNVMGEVIPLEITGNLQWNSLIGYYQMNTGSDGNNVAAGIIDDISTASPNSGKLNAMTLIQVEDAPIPYVSRLDDSWDNETTWSASAVQQIPNSKEDNIVPNDLQTWNIVRTATNVAANRSASSPQLGKTTLLGLLVDNNTLSIQSDQPLQVNKYLKIDGTLDLEGESQLLQPTGSIVDYSGTGKLERDQQGTSNEFNYNYWGSPVSNAGSTTNRTYALASILYDGTNPVSWTTNNDAPGTSPATISSRWLYTYANLTGAYADWNHINQNTGISVGLGFTMKGSGIGTSEQNYTFSGQPNNGTITHTITRGNETLLGNPYPSAIDAHTFIDDNEAALLDGSALIFWEQAPNNPSHILSEYLGRYSYLTKTGGVPATTPVEIGGDGGGTASKIPGRYIPVGQGFFVEADGDGGTLVFNNAQRIFKKEGSQSIFLRSSNDNEDYVNIPNDEESVIRRLRFNFTTPEGAVRHLLLGFTTDNVATDGVDYGYDALNADDFPSDLSFLIEGQNYVIQGVGEFDETKVYPLEMVVGETGNIEIGLTELENFDDAIDVYIFDAVEGTYTRFNDVNFQINLETGTYSDRFFLVFQEDETLSTIKDEFKDITVRYLHDTDEIYVKTPPSVEVKQLYLINVAGQTVAAWNATNLPMSNDIKIAVKQISEGAYIIKAETNTGTFNKKIIIKY